MNSYFHRAIHQDRVWEQAFLLNGRPETPSLMTDNPWIATKWKRYNPHLRLAGINSPRNVMYQWKNQLEDVEESLSSDELVELINERHALDLEDLNLVYRVNGKHGWYKTNDGYCYYIIVDDWQESSFRVIYARLTEPQLELIIQQVVILEAMKCRLWLPLYYYLFLVQSVGKVVIILIA